MEAAVAFLQRWPQNDGTAFTTTGHLCDLKSRKGLAYLSSRDKTAKS